MCRVLCLPPRGQSETVQGIYQKWYNRPAKTRGRSQADRPLEFVASSKDDLASFPREVKLVTGFALRQIQAGKSHPDAKQMKGNLRDVIEISVDDESGERTFRTTCTTKIGKVVYVLHAFQKKSKSGIATPERQLRVIEQRLKAAREHYEEHYAKKKQ